MYCLKCYKFEHSILEGLSEKQSPDNGIYWLNPLFIGCKYIL